MDIFESSDWVTIAYLLHGAIDEFVDELDGQIRPYCFQSTILSDWSQVEMNPEICRRKSILTF